jgi:hypothetical protein
MNSAASFSQEAITRLDAIHVSLFNPGGHPLDSRCRTCNGVLADHQLHYPATFISMTITSIVSHGPGALETGPVCYAGAGEGKASKACMYSKQHLSPPAPSPPLSSLCIADETLSTSSSVIPVRVPGYVPLFLSLSTLSTFRLPLRLPLPQHGYG